MSGNQTTSRITARHLLRGNEIVEYPLITVDGGHITSILSHESAASQAAGGEAVYRFPEAMLVPAFLNIHVHGAAEMCIRDRSWAPAGVLHFHHVAADSLNQVKDCLLYTSRRE